jgi:hypothetical protein
MLISAEFQLHEQALKKHADEKRRVERKHRHLQDDLRYALKKLAEPLDINMSYEAVSDSSSGSINKRVDIGQAVPLIENLPEFQAIDDDEGRRAAFSKFVKRQKVRYKHCIEYVPLNATFRNECEKHQMMAPPARAENARNPAGIIERENASEIEVRGTASLNETYSEENMKGRADPQGISNVNTTSTMDTAAACRVTTQESEIVRGKKEKITQERRRRRRRYIGPQNRAASLKRRTGDWIGNIREAIAGIGMKLC